MRKFLIVFLVFTQIGGAFATDAPPPVSRLEAVPKDFSTLASNVGQILLKVPAMEGGGGEDTKEVCTGLAISRSLIITARHCFYELTGGHTAFTGIVFWRARIGQTEANSGTRHNLKKDFAEESKALDLVVLETVEPMPIGVGLRLQYSSVALEAGKSLFILHHPGQGSMVLTRFECETSDPAIEAGSLHHTCDTSPGSSGAPIFNLESKLVGFHQRGGRTSDPKTYNSGVAFQQARLGLSMLAISTTAWTGIAAIASEDISEEYKTSGSNYFVRRGVNWTYRVGAGPSYKIFEQSTDDAFWEFWREDDRFFNFPKAGGTLKSKPNPFVDWTEIGTATKTK
jgi:V8-like Glu-specific endopeptidase